MRAQNMIVILGSIVNIIWKKGEGAGGAIWPFYEHKNIHFDNE